MTDPRCPSLLQSGGRRKVPQWHRSTEGSLQWSPWAATDCIGVFCSLGRDSLLWHWPPKSVTMALKCCPTPLQTTIHSHIAMHLLNTQKGIFSTPKWT